MPAVRRLCPAENVFGSSRFCGNHRTDEIVHKSIVVRPVADSGWPGFQQAELGIAEFVGQVLQQEYRGVFVLVYIAIELIVRDLQEELEVKLFEDFAPFVNYSSTQIARTPGVGSDLFLEKPLRGLGMLGGAAR